MTPEIFNNRRKQFVKAIRKQNTEKVKSKAFRSEKDRLRFKKVVKHRKKIGYGKMCTATRFDSLESDSFGIRLILKTRVELEPFIVPITGPVEKPAPKTKKPKTEKMSKKERQIRAMNVTEQPQETDPALKNGVVLGIDEGRAKLFTSACKKKTTTIPVETSTPPIKKTKKKKKKRRKKKKRQKTKTPNPDKMKIKNRIVSDKQENCDYDNDNWVTTTLTRNKYHASIKLKVRQKWEARRVNSNPALRAAYNALSLSSLHSCDPESWDTRILAERIHFDILRADYFGDKERERWKMIAFRKKKSCLDRAIGDMINVALKGEAKDRPLVIGIGDAAFPPNGPRGEIAVPTSKLAAAYKRAFRRVRKTGRRVAALPISENYTTKACCECGMTTNPLMVKRTWCTRDGTHRTAHGESRRLRLCTTCTPTGKLRDRDVQAARNMHRATVAIINGLARPAHLCRAAHVEG